MEGLKNDTSGQWILLSGLAIAIALVTIAVLLNQANLNGYYSADTAIGFPKDDIRELKLQTHEVAGPAADIAYSENQTSNQSIDVGLSTVMDSYNEQVQVLYAAHGEFVDVEYMKYTRENNSTNNSIGQVWVNVTFLNADTSYSSIPEIIEVGP